MRLASRLVGWELDIRTKTTAKEEAEKQAAAVVSESAVVEAAAVQAEPSAEKPKKKEKKKKKSEEPSLLELPGVGEKVLESLRDAGYKSADDILNAGIDGLTKIKGIGEKKAEKIITEAKKIK